MLQAFAPLMNLLNISEEFESLLGNFTPGPWIWSSQPRSQVINLWTLWSRTTLVLRTKTASHDDICFLALAAIWIHMDPYGVKSWYHAKKVRETPLWEDNGRNRWIDDPFCLLLEVVCWELFHRLALPSSPSKVDIASALTCPVSAFFFGGRKRVEMPWG